MKAKGWMWLVPALAVSLPAWSQQAGVLRKCVSAKGAISFQQAPCGPGSRQLASHAYVTEPRPSAGQIRARAAREQAARAESAELSRRAGTVAGQRAPRGGGTLHRVTIARDDAACQRARRRRERTLETVGLKRSYDLLRRLNDEVSIACR